jgi:hypothetical protein
MATFLATIMPLVDGPTSVSALPVYTPSPCMHESDAFACVVCRPEKHAKCYRFSYTGRFGLPVLATGLDLRAPEVQAVASKDRQQWPV